MPELPEVQTTVDGINKKVKGLIIEDVWTIYNSSYHAGKDNIKNPEFFKKFKHIVVGKKIKNASRRAKNILIHLADGNPTILVHMKMTGHVMYGNYIFHKVFTGKKNSTDKNPAVDPKDPWRPDPKAKGSASLLDPFNRHIRLVFTLSNDKHLVLSDMRKFAKVTLLENIHEENIHLKNLGPEPLDDTFTYKVFKEQISKRPTGRIKSVLMDQSLIAGVGNIYSDEALWRAGIHPEERVSVLIKEKNEPVLKLLYKATLLVLKNGIDFGGDSMQDYRNIDGERGQYQEHHRAYQRAGKSCDKKGCKGTIIKKTVGGRTAHFCDTHQKLNP